MNVYWLCENILTNNEAVLTLWREERVALFRLSSFCYLYVNKRVYLNPLTAMFLVKIKHKNWTLNSVQQQREHHH